MSERFVFEKAPEKKGGDMILIFLLIVIAGIGLATLFSASYHNAETFRGDPLFFVKKQLLFLIPSVAAFLVASRISLAWIRRQIPVFLIVTLILNLLPMVPGIGKKVMGATRWLYIGPLSFQPSELIKIFIVLYLASLFAKNENRMDESRNVILPPFLVSCLFAFVVFVQNDYSTGILIFLLALMLFFVARVPMRFFLMITAFVLAVSFFLLFTKEHRVIRLITFLEPQLDPAGTGYQIIASQSALSRGGLWGAGLGRGVRKMGSLPEVHADFIFASLGEELGFFGVFAVVILFLLFAFRGYWLSFCAGDKFEYYLGVGYSSAILYQAFCNMAVVIGLVPATGIPLPFFSAGGSSLLVSFIMAGLLVNISRQNSEEREPVRESGGIRDRERIYG